MLAGHNFKTRDINSSSSKCYAYTGAYSPFGVPTIPFQIKNGIVRASGSILRANLDGSDLELIAWGLKNPFRLKFDAMGRLFSTNFGMDIKGSRPIDNSPDEFHLIIPGMWYGWPDYTGGLPVTLPQFKAEGKPQPEFLLASHPMIPPRPFTLFKHHSSIMGFDFDYHSNFGAYGDAYIAVYGSDVPESTGGKSLSRAGHRISRICINTGKLTTFAINKSGSAASLTGGGGLERPIDVLFGQVGS